MVEKIMIEDIHTMSVDKMKEQLGKLDARELRYLRRLETDAGPDRSRVTAVAAIDAAIDALGDDAGDAGDDAAADDAGAGEGGEAGTTTARGLTGDGDQAGDDDQVVARDGIEGEAADDVPGADRANVARLEEELAYARQRGDEAQAIVAARDETIQGLRSENAALTQRVVALEDAAREAGNVDAGPDPVVVPTPARALAGPTIKLFDGDEAIEAAGAIPTTEAEWAIVNGASVYTRAIAISRDLPRVTVSHVRLVDQSGATIATCEIPGKLRAGAGVEAQLPAHSLAFREDTMGDAAADATRDAA